MDDKEYYKEKFESIEKSILNIDVMLKKLIEKEEMRLTKIVFLELKVEKLEENINFCNCEIKDIVEKFRLHCFDHQGAAGKMLKNILQWVLLFGGALGSLGAMTGILIWIFKALGVVK